jgi:hypothetical protein
MKTFQAGVYCMEKITMVKKMENGIAVYYGAVAERAFESFNYSELIDMKINALDLLEHPQSYLLDKDKRLLISNK